MHKPVKGLYAHRSRLHFERPDVPAPDLIGDDDIVKITRLLINFFIRRNLTDTPPTRDLTRLFMAYIEEIEQNGYAGESVYSSFSNKSFEEKRDRKDNSGKYIGYRNGLNLNADVADKTAWTVDAIKARTDSMVEKILAMFQL